MRQQVEGFAVKIKVVGKGVQAMGFQEWVYFVVEVQARGFQDFRNKRMEKVGKNYTAGVTGVDQPIGEDEGADMIQKSVGFTNSNQFH